jgi:serine/threonine protein kinase
VRAIQKLCNGTHENIVEVFGHGWLFGGTFYHIDMELCDGTLADYIYGKLPVAPSFSKHPDAEVQRASPFWAAFAIMLQLTSGVKFMHSHHEVHRDLKPLNSKSPQLRKLTARSRHQEAAEP